MPFFLTAPKLQNININIIGIKIIQRTLQKNKFFLLKVSFNFDIKLCIVHRNGIIVRLMLPLKEMITSSSVYIWHIDTAIYIYRWLKGHYRPDRLVKDIFFYCVKPFIESWANGTCITCDDFYWQSDFSFVVE